jgi:hypothetical protein
MNNPIFQNDYEVDAPANESYNEVVKYRRKLEIAVNNKIAELQQHHQSLNYKQNTNV